VVPVGSVVSEPLRRIALDAGETGAAQDARAWMERAQRASRCMRIAGIWNDMTSATGEIEPFAMRFDATARNEPHGRYHNQYALLMR